MLRLSFVNEMESMQRELDHLFSGLGFASGRESQLAQHNYKVIDNGDSFTVEAPLPGLEIEKLDIEVLGRHLTISGKAVAPELPAEIRYQRQERGSGTFTEKLTLAADLDNEKIVAEYKQGILQIKLPKAASALPQKITINAS